DWFVGLDSLNLCENGHFVDSVTVEVSQTLFSITSSTICCNSF
ncbi:MAG TPA: hypothetical protein EYQ00_01140, partial [Dehalococcoidia bacterium]|nr:hypothetical protein [Dehalococcoidia bacterium]